MSIFILLIIKEISKDQLKLIFFGNDQKQLIYIARKFEPDDISLGPDVSKRPARRTTPGKNTNMKVDFNSLVALN